MMLSNGLPGGDRTPDPQLRRLMLYPTELRAGVNQLPTMAWERASDAMVIESAAAR